MNEVPFRKSVCANTVLLNIFSLYLSNWFDGVFKKGPFYKTYFWKHYTVCQENWDFDKNMLLLKNTQILSNHCETLSKQGVLEDLILTKFRNDWIKIVDFLIKAYFC